MTRNVYAQNSFVNFVLVYLLLFASGASRFNQAQDKFTVIIFLVALVAWYAYTDRRINSGFLLFLSVFCGFLFSLSLYTGGSLSVESTIKTAMMLVLAYLILRTVGTSFAETYIRLVVYLAVVSLVGYMIDVFHLFDGFVTKLPKVGFMGYEGFLYTFRHAYHPERNNSIFFEPGAYQWFLNAAIFLLVFARTQFTNKSRWTYIVILVVTLVTAGSTTGFIIFSFMFMLFLYRSDLATYTQKIYSVGAIILFATIFSAQFYKQIVVKLDDYINPDEARKGWSAENRSFDLQTDIIIIKKHVFGLGYEKYNKEFSLVGRLDAHEGSSNGITSTLASYGVPFGIFIFAAYYLSIRVLLHDFLLASSAFLMFLMFLWGESYYRLAPISLAIIAAAFVFGEATSSKHTQSKSATA